MILKSAFSCDKIIEYYVSTQSGCKNLPIFDDLLSYDLINKMKEVKNVADLMGNTLIKQLVKENCVNRKSENYYHILANFVYMYAFSFSLFSE